MRRKKIQGMLHRIHHLKKMCLYHWMTTTLLMTTMKTALHQKTTTLHLTLHLLKTANKVLTTSTAIPLPRITPHLVLRHQMTMNGLRMTGNKAPTIGAPDLMIRGVTAIVSVTTASAVSNTSLILVEADTRRARNNPNLPQVQANQASLMVLGANQASPILQENPVNQEGWSPIMVR
jgi:hypothetical protein